MWTVLVGLVGAVLGAGGVGGAIAYVYRRRAERAPERDALAIEQAKVQLAQNIRGLLESADPTVRERAQPMLDAMIETSVKALSTPPVRKQLTAAERQEQEDERHKRELAERIERARNESEENAARERKHVETMVSLYRTPLINTASACCVYAEQSAAAHAKALDLEGFNLDWDIFRSASHSWAFATTGEAQTRARKTIAELDGCFRAHLEQLNRALKQTTLKQSTEPKATASQLDAKPTPQLTDKLAPEDPPT